MFWRLTKCADAVNRSLRPAESDGKFTKRGKCVKIKSGTNEKKSQDSVVRVSTSFHEWWFGTTKQNRGQLVQLTGMRYDVLRDIAQNMRDARLSTARRIIRALSTMCVSGGQEDPYTFFQINGERGS